MMTMVSNEVAKNARREVLDDPAEKVHGEEGVSDPDLDTGAETRTLSTDPPENTMAGKVRLWLEQERILDRVLDREDNAFHFLVAYNSKVYRCLQPKEAPDKVVLVTTTRLSPDHQTALSVLDDTRREKFYWELRLAFLHRATFGLRIDDGGLLQEFTLSKVIYEDGLTKDRLMGDLHRLHDTNLAGIWCIQRRFGPGGDIWNSEAGTARADDPLRPEMYR